MKVQTEDGISFKQEVVSEKWKDDFSSLYNSELDINDYDVIFYDSCCINSVTMETDAEHSNVFINGDISYKEVETAGKNLKINKAVGFDGITNEVIKQGSIICILHKLFNFCFTHSLVPSDWLKGLIAPIPKGAGKDPCVPLNYRGITLLSCVSKTYTSISNKRISNYLETSNILTEEQSGFRKNRSCLDNLFSLTTIIRNVNAEGRSVISAFLDMKKAFDWIDRDLSNYKLSSVGINGKIYNIIKRLYQNTTSCIKLSSINTEWLNVKSGGRQGDSLSPTLFKVYVNDLVNELNSLNMGIDINGRQICCLLYAYDIVIFTNTADKLQALLDLVHNWCFKWKMKLNYNKSNVMHFRISRRSRTTVLVNFDTTALTTVSTYKYLGVLLDEHLNFDKAVEELCHSAGRALGTIIGKFKTLRNVGYNT